MEETMNQIDQKRGPGRPALPPDERARRKAEQSKIYKRRNEARRRATVALRERHSEEFKTLLEQELNRHS